MKFYPTKIIKLISTTFVLFLFFSCTSDSDLLTDLVVEEAIITETTIDVHNAAITVDEDKAVSFNILNNTASKGSRRKYKSSKQPINGGLVIEKDSIAIYTPDFDFNGEDSIVITLEETNNDNTTSDVTMTVEVIVNPTKDVVDDKVETPQGSTLLIEPLENDNFNENSNVKISQISNASKGNVVINDDNTLSYTPNSGAVGIDLFSYTTEVTNLDESVTKETGDITITIIPSDNTSGTSQTNAGPMGPLKAFPGAEGFGKNTTGGRGGKVLFVTNLNDSGAGSLRAAVEASGKRTVIFKVGGTIKLTSGLKVNNPFITIAGETAPGDGILLRGDIFQVRTHDVIVRHIRSRYGGSGEGSGDAMSVYASGQDAYNIIFDHVSVSWGGDENFNIRAASGYKAYNITLQNSIIAECGYGLLLYEGSNKVSIYRNLFAFNTDRNIRANYASGNNDFRYEMVNNLVFGFKQSPNNATLGIKYTLYNNKYKTSSSFSNNAKSAAISSDVDAGVSKSWSYAFIKGNDSGGLSEYSSTISPFIKSTPFATSGIVESALNTSELESELLNHIGAGLKRDAVDNRIINSYVSGTGNLSGRGTYPTIMGGTPYTDTDNDGIEDSFEIANWGSLATDNNTDSDGDGYTNLEVFLNARTIK